MTDKHAERQADEPLLETDSYRIWDGKSLSREERSEAKRISLAVGLGERVHEIVVFELGGGCTLKALSKQRIKDGRINVLCRVEKPGGRMAVLPSDEWMSQARYERIIGALKAMAGEEPVTVVRGEDIHVGLAEVGRRPQREDGAEAKEESEGSSPGPRKGAVEERGGDSHGS